MPISFSVDTALQLIANEKMGFRFGQPERLDDKSLAAVVPITRDTSLNRHYITLPETESVKISDTGRIDRMKFTNPLDQNVFVRAGTIFKGSTQERALTRSSILFPGKSIELDVRCVHASRGINSGTSVKHGGLVPHMMDQMTYDSGFRPLSQSHYWSSVNRVSARMASVSEAPRHRRAGSRSRSAIPLGGIRPRQASIHLDSAFSDSTDDLAGAMEDFAASFDEILRKVERKDSQVGLCLITEKGCESIELFDLQQSWEALHNDVLTRLGPNLAGKDTAGVFQYHPDKALDAVRAVLGIGYDRKTLFEHRPSNGEPAVRISALSAERYTGEAVEIDQRLIHLTLMKLAN